MSDTTREVIRGFAKDTVQQISASKNEPVWMQEKRLLGWRVFQEMPLPLWRRTDITPLKLDTLRPFSAPSLAGANAITGVSQEAQTLLQAETRVDGAAVQRDSLVVWSRLAPELAAQGVIFCDLDTAVLRYPDLVQRYFMTSAVSVGEHKFTALHSAFWSGGVLIYVPTGVQVMRPLYLLYWMDTPDLAVFSHTIIVAEKGSKVHVMEEYGSSDMPEGAQGLHSGVVEVFAGDGAEVTHSTIQRWGAGVFSLVTQRALLQRDSTMRWIGTLLGGKLLRQHTDTELEGQGAAMDMVGIFLASDRQHMDIDSFTDHIAPHTKGDVLYRGIIRDRARTIFQGLIKVQKAAQQTDSYLANHNLLLSPKARADSIPTLEIEANDVRCTHGATVGRVDEEQLFYLRSRGLSHDEAERLIVAGFVEPVLARIPAGPLRDHTRMAVEGKLGLPLPLEEEDALQHTNDASSLSRR